MPADATTRYQPGDRVRVRVGYPPGHFRTPAYIQGKSGQVVAVYGPFPNPESLAYGGSGLPAQPLYRIEFDQVRVWAQYPGLATDKVLVDIYGHWLEQA